MENTLAERLLLAMERRNPPVSYGLLSKMTGIPKATLQRYATGVTDKIPYDRLFLIARALGTSVGYLTGGFLETLSSMGARVEAHQDVVTLRSQSGVTAQFSPEDWQRILDGEKFDSVWSALKMDQERKDPPVQQREEDIRAAFFEGYADDLSSDEIEELWQDAKEYLAYKIERRRRGKE